MTTFDPNIPKDKFFYFHQLLCEFNGRYTSNPQELYGTVMVRYTFGDIQDSNNFEKAWSRYLADVVEIRSDQEYKTFFRRIKF